MRAVVQRVSSASVEVEGKQEGEIDAGLMVLLGISVDDSEEDVSYLVNKIINLRVFDDQDGRMNLNIADSGGEILVVSQFTLYGDVRKGNRPSYDKAAGADTAGPLYMMFLNKLKESGLKVEEGVFGATMNVNLSNYGPVTIMLDSKKEF